MREATDEPSTRFEIGPLPSPSPRPKSFCARTHEFAYLHCEKQNSEGFQVRVIFHDENQVRFLDGRWNICYSIIEDEYLVIF